MAEEPEPTRNAPPILSRSEAIRSALEAGLEGAEEGTAYHRKEVGIDLSPSLFLTAKATEQRKGWARHGKPSRKAKQAPDAGGDHDADEDDALLPGDVPVPPGPGRRGRRPRDRGGLEDQAA